MQERNEYCLTQEDFDPGNLLVKILSYGKHNEAIFTERLCDRLVVDCIRSVLGQKPLDCATERASRKSN